jgi:hypothetical protein
VLTPRPQLQCAIVDLLNTTRKAQVVPRALAALHNRLDKLAVQRTAALAAAASAAAAEPEKKGAKKDKAAPAAAAEPAALPGSPVRLLVAASRAVLGVLETLRNKTGQLSAALCACFRARPSWSAACVPGSDAWAALVERNAVRNELASPWSVWSPALWYLQLPELDVALAAGLLATTVEACFHARQWALATQIVFRLHRVVGVGKEPGTALTHPLLAVATYCQRQLKLAATARTDAHRQVRRRRQAAAMAALRLLPGTGPEGSARRARPPERGDPGGQGGAPEPARQGGGGPPAAGSAEVSLCAPTLVACLVCPSAPAVAVVRLRDRARRAFDSRIAVADGELRVSSESLARHSERLRTLEELLAGFDASMPAFVRALTKGRVAAARACTLPSEGAAAPSVALSTSVRDRLKLRKGDSAADRHAVGAYEEAVAELRQKREHLLLCAALEARVRQPTPLAPLTTVRRSLGRSTRRAGAKTRRCSRGSRCPGARREAGRARFTARSAQGLDAFFSTLGTLKEGCPALAAAVASWSAFGEQPRAGRASLVNQFGLRDCLEAAVTCSFIGRIEAARCVCSAPL